MIRLEHRDREEVGAVGPRIEVRERIDLLCGSGLGGVATWCQRGPRESTGVSTLEDVGEGHPVIDHEKERQVGDGLSLDLDREIGGADGASWR